jgi:AbrB family looped-hinge helix DNA binding protein
MLTAKISAKGQITLPKKIRQVLEVEPGERVMFVVEDKAVVLRALGPSSARALAGSLRCYAGRSPDTGLVRAVVKKEVGRAAAREG